MVVNIVFPLKGSVLRSQYQALLAISDQLTACAQASKDFDTYSESSFVSGAEPTLSDCRSYLQSD